MDATHNPSLKSWVATANRPGQDFPIQNLPFGIFSRAGEAPRGGVAIGEMILDLRAAISAGLLSGAAAEAAAGPSLNALMLNPGNMFHALKSDRQGQYAIIINRQWRIQKFI